MYRRQGTDYEFACMRNGGKRSLKYQIYGCLWHCLIESSIFFKVSWTKFYIKGINKCHKNREKIVKTLLILGDLINIQSCIYLNSFDL